QLSTLTWGDGNIDADPDFIGSDDYHLLASSSAINSGDPAETDGDNTVLDMGVYPYINTYTGPIFYVAEDGDDLTGTGAVDDEFASLQAAVNFALEGDTVLLGAGAFNGVTTLRDANLVIAGINGETILDGNGNSNVIFVPGGQTAATVIENLTITGGYAERGAGIYIRNSSPTIRHNTFRGNEATANGSAIYAYNSTSVVDYNLAYDNINTANNATITIDNGAPVFVNNTIADNAGTGFRATSNAAPIEIRNGIIW
ncbi:MAG: hypothetical protein GY869_29745, partial [Planctomycetes bacterium]|nr:hypothetical protein [Planctomycetota bacterium]